MLFFCCYLCEHLVIPLFVSDRWTPDRCYFSVVLNCVNIWSFLCLYRIGGPLTGAIFLLFLPVWTSGHSSVYIGQVEPWPVLFFLLFLPVWTSGHSSAYIGQVDPWPVPFFCCSYLCKHLVIPLLVSDRWTPDRCYFSVVLTCVNIWSFLCLYRIGGPLTGAIFLFLPVWTSGHSSVYVGQVDPWPVLFFCSYLCEHLVIPLLISDRWTPDRCYFSVLTCVNIWSFLCLYQIGGPLTGAIFLFLPVWTSGHSSVCIG